MPFARSALSPGKPPCPPPILAPPSPAQPAAWLCGLAWSPALLLGAAAGGALALARSQLAVQRECLTYVRLLGVRLETRRRCGLAGGERFLPLRQLGGIIIHEVGGKQRVRGELGMRSSVRSPLETA